MAKSTDKKQGRKKQVKEKSEYTSSLRRRISDSAFHMARRAARVGVSAQTLQGERPLRLQHPDSLMMTCIEA